MLGQVLFLTRSQEDNARFIQNLAQYKIDIPVIDHPLVRYEYSQDGPNKEQLEEASKIILTSRRSAEWVVTNSEFFKNKLFYVVGEETANFLNANSLKTEGVASNAEKLIKSLKELKSDNFLYVRGQFIKTDVCISLYTIGHECDEVIVYEALYLKDLGESAQKELHNAKTILVPLFSERSAQNTLDNLQLDTLDNVRTRTKLLCLSPAVLKSLPENYEGEAYVCKAPNLENMCDLIKEKSDE